MPNQDPKKSISNLSENDESLIDSNARRYRESKIIADEIMKLDEINKITKNTLILIDLQGLYLSSIKWLNDNDFPIHDGRIPSRFALYLILDVISKIKNDMLSLSGKGAIDYQDLIKKIANREGDNINVSGAVMTNNFAIELFYAPSPLKDLKWELQKNKSSRNSEVSRQFADVSKGKVRFKSMDRDYRVYADFISKLKREPLVVRSEEGFFNFQVDQNGIKFFDEKEVDIRIAIRAMEQCIDKKYDNVCIVSSDQDFFPLHARLKQTGIKTYHADAAKFSNHRNIGRKIKGMGANHITVDMDRAWPLRVITELVEPALYNVSKDELGALCRIFNSLDNNFEIHMFDNDDGTAGFSLYKPLRH
ncbi:NYN domain-containing protein [Microvirga sp. RSM25]|uniref:NYN domain-containing protein n=1 Tax=Microvirga sp. RSM25 TaxID=3273802 RepID=UPI0038504E4E